MKINLKLIGFMEDVEIDVVKHGKSKMYYIFKKCCPYYYEVAVMKINLFLFCNLSLVQISNKLRSINNVHRFSLCVNLEKFAMSCIFKKFPRF